MDLQAPDSIGGKPRKLSRFMCQELLYDYVSGSLDHSRQEAIESYLPTCRDSMHELEKLRAGLDYARSLANIPMPARLMESLVTFEPTWQRTLRKVTLWSEERGWKFVAPLFLVATLVAAILVWSPWNDSRLGELAHIEHTTIVDEKEIAPQATAAVDAVTAPTSVPLQVGAAAEVASTSEKAAPNLGEVHRATYTLENLPERAESLRLKILELEGEMRPKGDSVFDFTLPESKLEELKTYLSTFGPVRLRKDKRPQEMPPGRIRIILVLKAPVPKEVPPPVEMTKEPAKEPAADGDSSDGTAPTETP